MKLHLLALGLLTLVSCTKKTPSLSQPDSLLRMEMLKRVEKYTIPFSIDLKPACALGEIDAIEMDQALVASSNFLVTAENASHIIFKKNLGKEIKRETWEISLNPAELNLPIVLSLCLDTKNSGECSKKESLSVMESRGRVLKNMGSFGSKPGDFVYLRKILFPQSNGQLFIPTLASFSGLKRQETVSYFLKSLRDNLPASTFFLKSLQQTELLQNSDLIIKGHQLILPLVGYDSKLCGVK